VMALCSNQTDRGIVESKIACNNGERSVNLPAHC
jgi:hypothetical protein